MLKQTDAAADRRALFAAVLSLKTSAECESFFADLCTPAELEALSGRWRVARLLDKGIPYREISQKTGISTATVTRVARCLTYGSDGGYRRLLDRAAGGDTMTVKEKDRLAIAVQKSGRLNDKSMALLSQCGLTFDAVKWKEKLVLRCSDFPLDLMMVRDDDIPEYVASGTCEMGIVGENVLEERARAGAHGAGDLEVLRKLGFGRCRLSLAVPAAAAYDGPKSLDGKRIATSYPGLLGAFLKDQAIRAEVVTLSGSVEIAPSLHIADAVCDLVSTGSTLHSNGLREVQTVFESQAVLIGTRRGVSPSVAEALRKILIRVDGVRQAARSKYIMMNAPKSALPAIQKIIPGMEEPSIMPLGTSGERIAIHAVAREDVFWDTIEKLKAVGASSILVLPIEKIIS